MKKRRALYNIILVQVVFIIFFTGWVLAQQQPGSKTFKIRFKEIDEVSVLIKPLLSDNGTITMQPHLKTITVNDAAVNIKKIEDLISDYDIPSPSVRMYFKLIEAEEKKGTEELKNAPEYILKMRNIFKYTNYNVLDEALLETAEGQTSNVIMGKDYRISFKITYVNARNGIIQLRNFIVQKRDKAEKEMPFKNLLTTSLNLKDTETVIIGATKWENSPRALFIALTAQLKR